MKKTDDGRSPLEVLILLAALHGAYSAYVLQLSSDGTFVENNNRLFLGHENMSISCRLTGGTPLSALVEPTATLWNSSWSTNFNFSASQTLYQWEYVLNRSALDKGHTVEMTVPKEQWRLSVEVIVDEVTISTVATILDKVAEPILFWVIGTELTSPPSVMGDITRIRHSSCARDVVILAYKTQASNGFYFARSYAGFQSGSVQWFHLTSYQLCGSGCSGTDELIDIVLTNHRLMVLTTAGLHISNDIRVYNTSISNILTFQTVFNTPDHVVNAVSSIITYAGMCAWRQHDLIPSVDDVVTLVITDNTGSSRAWYAKDPFSSWQEASSKMSSVQFIDSLYNLHMKTLTSLVKSTVDNVIYSEVVRMNPDMSLSTKGLVRPFPFPSSTELTRLDYMPFSSFLYATGKQVWFSDDGGNIFTLIHSLDSNDEVTAIIFDIHEKIVVMETKNGFILYGKPGILRLTVLSTTFTPATAGLHIDALSRVMSSSIDSGTGLPSPQQINPADEVKLRNSAFARPLAAVFLDHERALLFEHEGIGATGSITSLFSNRNIGQQITASLGGTGLIREVRSGTFMEGFLSVVEIKVTSTWYRDNTSLDLCSHTLGVTYVNQAIGTAQLYLQSYQAGEVGWSAAEVSKTVVIPGATSFLITGRINASHVEATAVMYAHSTFTRSPRTWYLLDLGVFSGVPSWTLTEPECLHRIEKPVATKWISHYEMDLHDSLNTVIKVFNADGNVRGRPPLISVTLSNPWLLKANFKTDFRHSSSSRQLNVSLANFVPRTGVTSVRFQVSEASLLCEDAGHTVLIYSGCPCLKRLRFIHSHNVSEQEFLYTMPLDNSSSAILKALPFNYRPPSKLGVGVPTSVHIYNADPSKVRPHNTFKVSKESGEFKQCKGALNVEACGCTDFLRLSPHPNHSDCRQKAFRILHPGVLQTHFVLEQHGREEIRIPDSFFVKITEINDRAPAVSINKYINPQYQQLRTMMKDNPLFPDWSDYFVPNGLQVVMNGSGLYHFKAEVVRGVSLCDLSVYFLLYVDQTPIAYPLQYVLNFGTALIFGGSFFGLYIWYYFNHHVHRVRRVGSQCLEPHMIDY